MANSPLLGIPLVSSNQSNKETTISDGFVILEKSLNDALAISAASGDVVLADLDFKRYMVFKVSGHTVNRSVTIINSKRLFMVHNKGTGILTIKTADSTTNPTIAGGSVGIFLCDGANGILKIADSAAAILVQHLIDLNDTPNSYIGQSGKVLAVKLTEDGVEFVSTDKTLAELTDGPGGYDDANLKYLRIKADGTGFEFVSANPGGETEFILLNDVPSSYAGHGGYFLRVKSTADGLEFVAPNNAINFTQLKDTPHSLSGQANKAVFVKSDETGLVFSDLPDPAVYTTVLVDDANLDFDTGSLTGWAITAGDPAKHVVGTLIDGKSPAGGTYLYAFYDETANVGEITRTIDLTAYGTGTELDSDAKVIFGLNYQSLDPDSSGTVTFDMCASSGAVLRTETFDDLSAQDAWAAVTRTFSIPAGTRTVLIRVHSEGTGTGAFMAWDSFALSLRLKQPQDFLGLTDTPDTYTGNEGKLVRVKTGGGLEFAAVKATELSDVPDSLTGQAGKLIRVNSAETGFEFGTAPVALPTGGLAGQVLTKNSGTDGDASWADPTGGSGGVGGTVSSIFAGARVYRASGSYTVPSTGNNFQDIAPFNTELFDTHGFWDAAAPGVFTIPTGVTKVRVAAFLRTDINDSFGNNQFLHRIIRGGVSIVVPGVWSTGDGGYANPGINVLSGIIPVQAGDQIALRAATDQTGAVVADNSAWEIVALDGPLLFGDGTTAIPPVLGNAGKVLAVKSDESGLEWSGSAGGGGASFKGPWGVTPGTRNITFDSGLLPADFTFERVGSRILLKPDAGAGTDMAYAFPSIGDSQTTYFSFGVDVPTGGGTLLLRYRCSSEGPDRFRLKIDDGSDLISRGGVDTDYVEFTTPISAGAHTITCRYSKDSTQISGDDTIYISKIAVSDMVPATYVAGDTVTYGADLLYMCLVSGTLQAPGDGDDWRLVAGSAGGVVDIAAFPFPVAPPKASWFPIQVNGPVLTNGAYGLKASGAVSSDTRRLALHAFSGDFSMKIGLKVQAFENYNGVGIILRNSTTDTRAFVVSAWIDGPKIECNNNGTTVGNFALSADTAWLRMDYTASTGAVSVKVSRNGTEWTEMWTFTLAGADQAGLYVMSRHAVKPVSSTIFFYDDTQHPASSTPQAAVLPYVVSLYADGTVDSNETLLFHPAALGFTIPAGGAGTFAKALVAATGSTVLSLKKNGTSIGTITFEAGATTGTVAVAADAVFVPGDVLSMTGPLSADATLANIGFTISGTRN